MRGLDARIHFLLAAQRKTWMPGTSLGTTPVDVSRPASGYCTSSGQGTMVDFTVLMAIASATALAIPSSENG
jgi:hypothetical protein